MNPTADDIQKMMDACYSILDNDHKPMIMNARTEFVCRDESYFQDIDTSLLLGTEDGTGIFNDVTPDVIWPVSVGLIVDKRADDEGSMGEDGYLISKCVSISPKQARGKCILFSQKMMRMDHMFFSKNRKSMEVCEFYSFINGKWVEAAKGAQSNGETYYGDNGSDRTKNSARLSLALALNQRYEWRVSVGNPGRMSLSFNTDPTGIRRIFEARDASPSTSRRQVLKTWVTDHWRQMRADPDEEAYVRKHFRGATTFIWNGFSCKIIPAPYDLERDEIIKADREMMRLNGSDRRSRRSSGEPS